MASVNLLVLVLLAFFIEQGHCDPKHVEDHKSNTAASLKFATLNVLYVIEDCFMQERRSLMTLNIIVKAPLVRRSKTFHLMHPGQRGDVLW